MQDDGRDQVSPTGHYQGHVPSHIVWAEGYSSTHQHQGLRSRGTSRKRIVNKIQEELPSLLPSGDVKMGLGFVDLFSQSRSLARPSD